MAFILNESVEGYSEKMALFTVPESETGVLEVNTREYRPVSQLSGSNVLEFNIPNNGTEYLDLKDTRLKLTLQILDSQGVFVTNQEVGLINMPAVSIFRQMDLSLQQKTVTTSIGGNYAYKAMIDTLLETGYETQRTHLRTSGFVKDSAACMNGTPGGENAGLNFRAEDTQNRKTNVSTKLFMDIAESDQYLLNGIPLNIKLFPATDRFRLMYNTKGISSSALREETDPKESVTPSKAPGKPGQKTTGKKSGIQEDGPSNPKRARLSNDAAHSSQPEVSYSLNITDAVLSVPFVKVNPSLLLNHTKQLEKKSAIYPFLRSDLKTYNIPAENYNFSVENIFQDNIPKRLVIGLVPSSNYSGHPEKNPFEFKHFNVEYLSFEIDGQSVPHRPLQPNYEDNNYNSAYATLFDTRPKDQKQLPNIDYYDYSHGYTLYVLDLDGTEQYLKPRRKGNTRLTLKFKTQLLEAATVILYGVFESVMNIDEARNIHVVE